MLTAFNNSVSAYLNTEAVFLYSVLQLDVSFKTMKLSSTHDMILDEGLRKICSHILKIVFYSK